MNYLLVSFLTLISVISSVASFAGGPASEPGSQQHTSVSSSKSGLIASEGAFSQQDLISDHRLLSIDSQTRQVFFVSASGSLGEDGVRNNDSNKSTDKDAFDENFAADRRDELATCYEDVSGCVEIGKWNFSLGMGLGIRSNPLFEGDDIPIVILPEFSYYGKRFFIDNFSTGFTLFEGERHSANILLTPSFDQMFFNEWGIGNFSIDGAQPISGGDTIYSGGIGGGGGGGGLDGDDISAGGDQENPGIDVGDQIPFPPFTPTPDDPTPGQEDPTSGGGGVGVAENPPELDELHDRNMAGLLGFEYGLYGEAWSVQFQVLTDITSTHDGSEFRFALEKSHRFGSHTLSAATGGVWQSEEILDYYYGIYETEVPDASFAYKPEGGFSPFLRLDWHRPISKKWSLRATVHQKWLSSEISDSPLIEEQSVTTVYFGGVYHF